MSEITGVSVTNVRRRTVMMGVGKMHCGNCQAEWPMPETAREPRKPPRATKAWKAEVAAVRAANRALMDAASICPNGCPEWHTAA